MLYPDDVVFLGGAPLAINCGESLEAALERWQAAGYPRPRWVIILGIAVADEMARCFADVAARIPPDCALTFLQAGDIAALADWDAEKYRQKLTKTLN